MALEVLTRVRRDDAFANLLLPELLETADLDRRDAGFATALTYGTLRLQGRYDAMIAACTDRPLERIDPAVLDVLRLGAHQLMGMRVAQHAAVSTTVDLATTSCGRGAATFVNAVLRRLSGRDLDSWMDELRRDAPDKTAALARTQSHPEWIVKALRQALVTHGRSDEELEAILAADNADPEVALCARPGLIAPEALAKAARKADRAHDVEPRPGRISPLAVVMVGGDPGRIEAIRDCRAGVEDEGSQLVALVA
ncbi:transcription antitermination factor NusB, partial [Actinomyces oris]